ncbi:MAG: hypothetical protein ABSG57_01125 [Candidatus Bathyarchaeia archaeon]
MEKPQKMKIVSVKEIPFKLKKKGDEWLQQILKIPPGKAWVLTEEEAGIQAASLRMMVDRLKKIGELSDHYKLTQRMIKGKVTVYIINTAEEKTELV